MAFSITDFKSQMDRFGGPQRQSLFEVTINNFPVNTSAMDTRDLTFFCKNVAIPGLSMALTSYEAVGQQRRMYPTMMNPEPVQAIFMLDSDHQVLTFFHSWMQRIVNYSTSGGSFSEVGGQLPFEIGYKNEYGCRLTIKAYSNDFLTTGKYYETILDGAFPGLLGDVDLGWESNDSYSTLPVSFQYDRIEFSGERQGITSGRFNRGNGLLGLIESVGDFGQLIGQNIVPRSIQDSVNKFTRITNNFDNISSRVSGLR